MAERKLVGGCGELDILLAERIDAHERIAVFRGDQRGYRLLLVDIDAEILEACGDGIALRVGDSDLRVLHRGFDRGSQLLTVLPCHRCTGEHNSRSGFVLIVPTCRKEAGNRRDGKHCEHNQQDSQPQALMRRA